MAEGTPHQVTAEDILDENQEAMINSGIYKLSDSFNVLKEILIWAQVLSYPDFWKSFVLEVYASLKGLGVCLSQEGEDGGHHPIAYASRQLEDTGKSTKIY